MKPTPKQLAGRTGGLSRSAAKRAASAANGAKGGRPRKDGTVRQETGWQPSSPPNRHVQLDATAPPPSGTPAPLWQRLEAFLRANGPTTLRSLRCVAVDLAERERVRQELQRRPTRFRMTPAPSFGGDVWELLS